MSQLSLYFFGGGLCALSNAQTHTDSANVHTDVVESAKILAFQFSLSSPPVSWQFGKHFHFQRPFCSVYIAPSGKIKSRLLLEKRSHGGSAWTKKIVLKELSSWKFGEEKQTSQKTVALKFFLCCCCLSAVKQTIAESSEHCFFPYVSEIYRICKGKKWLPEFWYSALHWLDGWQQKKSRNVGRSKRHRVNLKIKPVAWASQK